MLCFKIRAVDASHSLAAVVQLSHIAINSRQQHSGVHRLPGMLGSGLYFLSGPSVVSYSKIYPPAFPALHFVLQEASNPQGSCMGDTGGSSSPLPSPLGLA